MRARQSILAVAVCSLALFNAVGCTAETSGAAQAAPTSDDSAVSTADHLPSNGAPPVPEPLDYSSIKTDACSALTDEQVASFIGILKKTHYAEVDSSSPYCFWVFKDPDTGFFLADLGGGLNLEESANGLSSIYGQHKAGRLELFEPISPIAGYPAVIYSSTGGREGTCVLAVGLTEKRAYVVNVDINDDHPKHAAPCSVAKKLAGYVVQNLKQE